MICQWCLQPVSASSKWLKTLVNAGLLLTSWFNYFFLLSVIGLERKNILLLQWIISRMWIYSPRCASTCLEQVGSGCTLLLLWLTFQTLRGSSSERQPRDRKHMGWFQNALSLWNIGNTISNTILHAQTFTAFPALFPNLLFSFFSFLQPGPGGFFFFTCVWLLTGLQLWVIVRSSFFCQGNREASSGPI